MAVAKAVWNQIQSSDHRVMRRVHRWGAPRWFRIFMVSSTRLGDGWLWHGMGIVLAIFGGAERFRAIGAGAVAAGAGILLFRFLKKVSKRQRPCEIEPHCWAVTTPPDQFSFPSGHTITAFAVSVAIGSFYPDLQWWLLLAAASVAASRIFLGMHFLSDVLAGSAIGTLLGLASFHCFAAL
ncbi:MAG TPA: phosphatase PAP2 family protein [Acidobacteriaceae bacterium]|jgi:undecaprenyl-diphosphatase|nr:phosphatase PAP2 family protein [Acidobacteriaceae bacterium]